jgi:hypothetical protein
MRLPLDVSRLRALRALLVGLCCVPATALAATQLSWMQPAGSPAVSEFRVYAGSTPAQGELVYAGMPAPVGGMYSVDVQIDEIDQGLPVTVWLTAWNESGESQSSNAISFGGSCDVSLDADCDGVPDDGAPGWAPCATGESLDCDDNCPFEPNPGQEDVGGVGVGSPPDGIGNACQCGDVTGDGRATSADAAVILKSLMVPPLAVMAQPRRCDVFGSLACSSVDGLVVLRAQLTPPPVRIQQQCEPAQPLSP